MIIFLFRYTVEVPSFSHVNCSCSQVRNLSCVQCISLDFFSSVAVMVVRFGNAILEPSYLTSPKTEYQNYIQKYDTCSSINLRCLLFP